MTSLYYPLKYYSTYFSLTLLDVFSCVSSRYYLVSVAESTTTRSSNNFTIIYEYLLVGAEILIVTHECL